MTQEQKVQELLKPRYKVYTLTDPITGEIRYIGSTKHALNKRLATQVCNTETNRARNPLKMVWINGLRSKGLKPLIEVIEEFDDEKSALQAEEYWTYQFRAWDFPLLNIFYGKKPGDALLAKRMPILKTQTMPAIAILRAGEVRKKSVLQMTKDGQFVKWWNYIIEASRELNIDRSDITKSCKNPQKAAGGFKWKYCTLEEYKSDYHAYISSQQK